ncbi:MAG: MerR family transcriptional regulator [Candidatus Omnitrophota bacterium]
MTPNDLPDKLAFKRSEVIKITRLDGKVIDYWQNEFDGFQPTQNATGEIFYSRADVELILKIKQWLIEDRIEKAKIKEMLRKSGDSPHPPSTPEPAKKDNVNENLKKKTVQVRTEKLKIIQQTLRDILTILDKSDKNKDK